MRRFRTGCISTIKLRSVGLDFGDGSGRKYETMILANGVHGGSDPVRAHTFFGAVANHLRAIYLTGAGKVEAFA